MAKAFLTRVLHALIDHSKIPTSGVLSAGSAVSSVSGLFSSAMSSVSAHASFIQLSAGVNPSLAPTAEGALWWDSYNHALSYRPASSAVIIQVGQEHVVYGRNDTGSTIGNGACIRVTGGAGDFPKFGLASCSANPSEVRWIGIATQDIVDNEFGYVTVAGLVRGINTAQWGPDGQEVKVGTTLGTLQSATPAYPYYNVPVGVIINSHSSDGILLVQNRTPVGTNAADLYRAKIGFHTTGSVSAGNITGVSAYITDVSATTYHNISTGDTSAWATYGANANVNMSGHALSGASSISGTNLSGLSGYFTQVSAGTYLNVPGGDPSGWASYPAVADVSASGRSLLSATNVFTTGTVSGATGQFSIVSAGSYVGTFNYLPTSGGTVTGNVGITGTLTTTGNIATCGNAYISGGTVYFPSGWSIQFNPTTSGLDFIYTA